MDATQREKVYVAVGNDVQEGFKSLNWVLKKWNKSHPISIVILHLAPQSISMEYVYTPIGKLPARSVNDEKLEVLKKYEKEKIKKLFSKYIAYCTKVKVPAEVLEVEKFDEPIQKRIIDLIFRLGITKLVIGFSFMKPSMKSKGTISGLFYVHQHKPNFCELFIICGGKQVFLAGKNDEKIVEDDNGVVVAKTKDKATFKDWLEKMFIDKSASTSSTNLESPVAQSQWELCLRDIDNYYQELMMSSILEEGKEIDGLHISPIEPDVTERNNSNTINCPTLPPNQSAAEKIEILQNKLNEAHKKIQLKRKEAKDNVDRRAKAEWAICLCNSRGEEVEREIKEESRTREALKKELELEKEQTAEVRMDVEESKRRLASLTQLQSELSNRLHVATLAKSRAESQLEKAVTERGETVREIEELRRQRDVLSRRIEFCKQKDAIGMATRTAGGGGECCGFREYTGAEVRLATDNFSHRLRLKCGGDFTNVYRGRFGHCTVAIKILEPSSFPCLSQQEFQSKVRLIGDIRHPHLVAMLGFCSDPKCLILEYMHNGSLRDMLFSVTRNRDLKWHDRIRIATQVCSGLGFLNSLKPRPATHCHLTPSNVLLDRNLVAKITGFGLRECHDEECNDESDIRAVGVLLLHLLTGRNWVGLVDEAMMVVEMDIRALVGVLDEMAGPWPFDLAQELAGLAIRCMSTKDRPTIEKVMEEVREIGRKGDELVARDGRRVITHNNVGGIQRDGSGDVPNVFICPVLQEVMKNPHVAADGFSYELEAIEQWLQSGHDTSPMTNLRLMHTFLTPNHSLRNLIEDWRSNKTAKVTN